MSIAFSAADATSLPIVLVSFLVTVVMGAPGGQSADGQLAALVARSLERISAGGHRGGGAGAMTAGRTGPEGLSEEKESEVRASFARQGLMRAIGAELATLGPGRCTVEVAFSERVGQQQGFFHGGVIGAVADTAGGYAALSLLPVGSEVVTLEYKINFLRPAAGDRLLAEGSVLRAGRSVTVTRVDVFVEARGRRNLCAALQQSIMRALSPSS
jgi:uncharacterized protein (TIGR00369 family)